MPAQGGIRLMLVATDASGGAAPAAPAVSGQVTLSENSRIVFEPGDETVTAYYILEIVNGGSAPVTPVPAFAFDMPKGAQGTTLLDGSTPLARHNGAHVSLAGPVPPGKTTLRVAYLFPAESGTLDITQTFPATLDRLTVLVRKARRREAGISPARAAAGVPERRRNHHWRYGRPHFRRAADLAVAFRSSASQRRSARGRLSRSPRSSCWRASGPRRAKRTARADGAARKRLIARREKLFGDLVKVERDRRSGRGERRSARRAARRVDRVPRAHLRRPRRLRRARGRLGLMIGASVDGDHLQ